MTHEPRESLEASSWRSAGLPLQQHCSSQDLKKHKTWIHTLSHLGKLVTPLTYFPGVLEIAKCSTIPQLPNCTAPLPPSPGVSLFGHRQAALGAGAHYKILLSLTQCSQRWMETLTAVAGLLWRFSMIIYVEHLVSKWSTGMGTFQGF